MPLVLYFDNDKPRYIYRADTTTTLTYEQTHLAYLQRKNTFINGYSRGLYGLSKDEAIQESQRFFTDEVEANYNKLQSFCQLLTDYLASGHRMEIMIEGYASPLAEAEYNRRLTGRRISSLINHFGKYNKGVLMSFLESGQLKITQAPKGEEYEHGGVSDDGKNRRQSVFSPAASRLRKVTILEIRAQAPENGSVPTK